MSDQVLPSRNQIYIDFQGGSHGNYLEFVCNRFLAGVDTKENTPFNDLGASHCKKYLSHQVFVANHYTTYNIGLIGQSLINILVAPDDLLSLQCISLLRAGDRFIEPEKLEIDTYHKLDNEDYRWVLDNIIDSFFDIKDQIDGYRRIKDPSWPEINSKSEYDHLPQHIKKECEIEHGFEFPVMNADHPDCPKHILREFFRIGFLEPKNHGFIRAQEKNPHTDCKIFYFPFAAFYDAQRFLAELEKIRIFFELPKKHHDQEIQDLHREFLARQPYKNIKSVMDNQIQKILNGDHFDLVANSVIEEAYIEAEIFKKTGINIAREADDWYRKSFEIAILIGQHLINPYLSHSLDNTNIPNLKYNIEKYYDLLFDTMMTVTITPRYVFESGKKIGYRDIFYYIDLLYDKPVEKLIDVGCGECIWKNWFPNIIGFDPNSNKFSQQDFVDFFDENFVMNHSKQYDCGMALNSLHFISWDQLPQQIDLAMRLVKHRFLFTLNFHAFTQTEKFSQENEQLKDLLKILHESPYRLVMFDCPIGRQVSWEQIKNNLAFLNGTVRFILEH